MKPSKYILPIICGPTAAGKTACAIAVAKEFDGEIVSADSRQLFRGIDIGTAKPTKDEQERIRHHFVDILSIDQDYTAGKFETDALQCIADINQRHKMPILVGGSGMYIKAVVDGFDPLPTDAGLKAEIQNFYDQNGLEALQNRLKKADPDYFHKVDVQNHMRLMRGIEILELTGKKMENLQSNDPKDRPFIPLFIGLDTPRKNLFDQIDRRVDKMIEEGLIEEARDIMEYRNCQALQTVGYKELFPYFDGTYDLARAIELVKRNTRRYAKRQLTWLRKNPSIKWFNPIDYQGIANYIRQQIQG